MSLKLGSGKFEVNLQGALTGFDADDLHDVEPFVDEMVLDAIDDCVFSECVEKLAICFGRLSSEEKKHFH